MCFEGGTAADPRKWFCLPGVGHLEGLCAELQRGLKRGIMGGSRAMAVVARWRGGRAVDSCWRRGWMAMMDGGWR